MAYESVFFGFFFLLGPKHNILLFDRFIKMHATYTNKLPFPTSTVPKLKCLSLYERE